MAVGVGDEAPDFTLRGPDGEPVTLSSFRGTRNVVLVFYPLAFSGVCTGQLTEIGAHEARYADADAQVIGVSVDSHHTQRAFGESLGLSGTLLLADFNPRGAVARAYGVFMEEAGIAMRASFVVDKAGVIRHADVQSPPNIPDEDAYFATLATCPV